MGISEKKTFELEQGEDKNIVVHLIDRDTDEPVDLTGASGVKARFRKADGTVLEKTLASGVSILSIAGAKVQVALTDAETALLMVGDKQDFEVEPTVGTNTTIVKFERALTVKAKIA